MLYILVFYIIEYIDMKYILYIIRFSGTRIYGSQQIRERTI